MAKNSKEDGILIKSFFSFVFCFLFFEGLNDAFSLSCWIRKPMAYLSCSFKIYSGVNENLFMKQLD